jgi:hypothetical protein
MFSNRDGICFYRKDMSNLWPTGAKVILLDFILFGRFSLNSSPDF